MFNTFIRVNIWDNFFSANLLTAAQQGHKANISEISEDSVKLQIGGFQKTKQQWHLVEICVKRSTLKKQRRRSTNEFHLFFLNV